MYGTVSKVTSIGSDGSGPSIVNSHDRILIFVFPMSILVCLLYRYARKDRRREYILLLESHVFFLNSDEIHR